jgi:hypothetical protein
MNTPRAEGSVTRGFLFVCVLLVAVLLVFFARSLDSSQIVFSNDGPLGVNNSTAARLPGAFQGWWADLNWVGTEFPVATPNFSGLFRMAVGPLFFAKLYAPACLFVLGLSAWLFSGNWVFIGLSVPLAPWPLH